MQKYVNVIPANWPGIKILINVRHKFIVAVYPLRLCILERSSVFYMVAGQYNLLYGNSFIG
jgi:hypothetical protein